MNNCFAKFRFVTSFSTKLAACDQSGAPKPGVKLRADSGLTYKIESVFKEDPKSSIYLCRAT